MKKYYKTVLVMMMLFGLSGCNSDNSYDGRTGLIGGGGSSNVSVQKSVETIYSTVMLESSKTVYSVSLTLTESIKDFNNAPTEVNLNKARRDFKALALSYKRVESSYVAGYNSDNMRDLADFYIEHFIKGSKAADIPGDLDKVFKGSGALVKNSLKGITALEYTLFGHQESSASIIAKIEADEVERTASAMIIIDTLSKNLKKIEDYYKSDATFTANSDDAISALLNVLVDNAYKLKEIRIGDAAGYTVKYKNDPDNTRLEYYKSTNSLEAIIEILNTHQSIMDSGLKEIAIAGNSSPEADAILNVIDEMQSICQSYGEALEDELVSANTLKLYRAANILQSNYTALINALNFTQDIIEADGD